MFFEIITGIFAVYVVFSNIFVIIKAFVRGFSAWGWGLLIVNVAAFASMSAVGNIESVFLGVVLEIVVFAFLIVPTIFVFLKTKLPNLPPVPCKSCGEEATARRRVIVNLDNNEAVVPRSTSLVLLIAGGALTVLGIWLFIFAIQYGQSVAAAVFAVMGGLSLLGTNFKALANKPKHLGLGYIYKCKQCGEKMVHIPESYEE